MLGQLAGALIGRKIGQEQGNHPLAGAIIGTATMMLARRILPARVAVIGATVAGGYLTKKWAEREARRQEMLKRMPAGTTGPGRLDPTVAKQVEGLAASPSASGSLNARS